MIPLADYYQPISAPMNNGLTGRGVNYPGFTATVDYSVAPGQALWLPLAAGDMIACRPNSVMRLAALDLADGRDAMAALLANHPVQPTSVSARDYDDRIIAARLSGMGLDVAQLVFYEFNQPPSDAVIWQSKTALILIMILPETRAALVRGSSSTASIDIQHHAAPIAPTLRLPPPLGPLLDEFTIPRGTARAYQIPQGAYVQIIDVEGRQCSDFMAFNAAALAAGKEQHIDSTVSRTFTAGAYPRPGLFNKFYDGNINPLLEVVQDTIGRHDTFALACTARGYEERGFPGHINCSDNISAAVASYGIGARAAWPAINFFFNSWILPTHNQLQSDEAWSRPGDYVLLKALTDVVAVSTACPDDIDPINGWHPTDIHIRLYTPKNDLKPAIAYRLQPNEPAQMTTESPFHCCTRKLTEQYHAHLDYWVPQYYEPYGALEEYWACRERAVMQDMSNLRIYDICGHDALPFLQTVLTRDLRRLSLNKGCYALICDDSGSVLDDGTLFNIGANVYRWTGGSGESLLHLKQVAQDKNYHVFIRDLSRTLCTLSVQGPLSGDMLSELLFIPSTQPSFAQIGWFGGAVARLHNRNGIPLYLSRTGYTGELGYELFCANHDAATLWDRVAAAGGSRLLPMGTEALGLLRVESGLMARGHEFGDMEDADEAGLGFAIDDKDFIGAAALARHRRAPQRKLVGLILHGGETAQPGDRVYHQRHQIGKITSAIFSPMLHQPIAMALLKIEHATVGNTLEIGKLDGYAKRLLADVVSLPFVDPQRKRPRGQ